MQQPNRMAQVVEKAEYNDRKDLHDAGLNNISNLMDQPKFKLKYVGAAEEDEDERLRRKQEEEDRRKERQKPKQPFNNKNLNNILLR